MASTGRIMEKQTQDQQQQQQPLRCPRCDSSNTKFCYYNNYSLSQPRHFCKACKRYWTKGGTLRNVPVGGGCRKNKRVKRPAAAASPSIDASTSGPHTAAVNSSAHQPQIDLSSASSNHMSSLFYGLPTNHSDLSRPFSTVTGYDLQSGMSGLGLGFSGGLMVNEVQDDDYRNGFNPIKQIQDLSATSNSFFPDLGSSSSTCTTTPTLASLLASGLQKNSFKDIQGFNNFHGFSPYEDQFQMPVNSSGSAVSKELKMMESGQNKADWNNNVPRQISQVQLMGPSSDPSLFWNINNNASNVWLDPASIGFSVPSLI